MRVDNRGRLAPVKVVIQLLLAVTVVKLGMPDSANAVRRFAPTFSEARRGSVATVNVVRRLVDASTVSRDGKSLSESAAMRLF